MPDLASKPPDVARLMTRLGVGRATYPQMIVCVEVTRAAIEARPLRAWKDIASEWHTDPASLSRAKALLGVRYVETPDGPRINLDAELWFPADDSFAKAKGTAQWLAEQCNGRLTKSPSANSSTSQLDQSDMADCGIDRIANSQLDQSVNSPRTPVGEAHAGANSLGLSEGVNPPIPRSSDVGAGEPCHPDYAPGSLDRVPAFVRLVFAPVLGRAAAEKLGAEVREFAPMVRPSTLKPVLVWAARECRKGGIKSPLAFIRSRAFDYDLDGPPSDVLAAMHAWERDRRTDYVLDDDGLSPRPTPKVGPTVIPMTAPAASEVSPIVRDMARKIGELKRFHSA